MLEFNMALKRDEMPAQIQVRVRARANEEIFICPDPQEKKPRLLLITLLGTQQWTRLVIRLPKRWTQIDSITETQTRRSSGGHQICASMKGILYD